MAKILSIDPGKSKCGLVLAELNEKKVYEAKVLNSELLENYIKKLNNVEDISKIIIGNGTTSREVIEKLSFFKKEIITPGIRFSSNVNDQKRTLTPKQAYRNGADWLVIGRDITKGNIKKNVQTLIDHLN